ncbi:MAG: hypothetical protein II816_03190, partial [Elusimicrobia bacterium]|nr:hypothetical protein [Elusimicrobiota bacterium]
GEVNEDQKTLSLLEKDDYGNYEYIFPNTANPLMDFTNIKELIIWYMVSQNPSTVDPIIRNMGLQVPETKLSMFDNGGALAKVSSHSASSFGELATIYTPAYYAIRNILLNAQTNKGAKDLKAQSQEKIRQMTGFYRIIAKSMDYYANVKGRGDKTHLQTSFDELLFESPAEQLFSYLQIYNIDLFDISVKDLEQNMPNIYNKLRSKFNKVAKNNNGRVNAIDIIGDAFADEYSSSNQNKLKRAMEISAALRADSNRFMLKEMENVLEDKDVVENLIKVAKDFKKENEDVWNDIVEYYKIKNSGPRFVEKNQKEKDFSDMYSVLIMLSSDFKDDILRDSEKFFKKNSNGTFANKNLRNLLDEAKVLHERNEVQTEVIQLLEEEGMYKIYSQLDPVAKKLGKIEEGLSEEEKEDIEKNNKDIIIEASGKLVLLMQNGWKYKNVKELRDYLKSFEEKTITVDDKVNFEKSLRKSIRKITGNSAIKRLYQSDKVIGEYIKENGAFRKLRQSITLVFSKTMSVFFGGFKYFNIKTPKQKAGFFALTAAFAAVTVFFVVLAFNPALSIIPAIMVGGIKLSAANLAVVFGIQTFLLPKYLVGKTDQKWSRSFMSSLITFFSIYWGGYLGAFFLQGIIANAIWTLPAILTTGLSLFLFLFIGSITFESIWQAGVAILAQQKAKQEAVPRMAKLKAWLDGLQMLSGLGAIAYLLSTILSAIPSGVSFGAALLGGITNPVFLIISAIVILLPFVMKLFGIKLGTSYTKAGWNKAMRERFKEFEDAERNGTLLPDGRICKDEMIRFIEHCTAMSMEERTQFIQALNGEKDDNGKLIEFPYPESDAAREQIVETIKNFSARKYPQFEYDAQPTMAAHVMAGSGEDYRKNIEFLFQAGSWDKNTTMIGHYAVEYPEGWSATLAKSRQEVESVKNMLESAKKGLEESSDQYKEIVVYLGEIDEILAFVDSLRKTESQEGLLKGTVVRMPNINSQRANSLLYNHVFYNIENFVGELKAYDGQVMIDFAREIAQAHYAYANEFVDIKYIKALDFVNSHYNAVKLAQQDYAEILKVLGAKFDKKGVLSNEEDVEKKLNELLNKGDAFAEKLIFAGINEFNKENIELIKYFVDKYEYVDQKVRTKNSFTLFEGPITNYIQLSENGMIANVAVGKIGMLNDLRKTIEKSKFDELSIEDKDKLIVEKKKNDEDGKEYVTYYVNSFAKSLYEEITSWKGKTLAQYSKDVCDFRASHIREFNDFVRENNINPANWELGNGFIRMMEQTNDLVNNFGIYFPWKINTLDQQWFWGGKNNNMAFDVAEFSQVMSIHDALVGVMYGQEIYDRQFASEYMQRRRTGAIQLNPTMLVPSIDKSPAGFAYGYAQDVWMNSTQKALSGLLTFYGKGIGDYHFAGTEIHTGEDSFMFMLERSMYNLSSRHQNQLEENSSTGISKFTDKIGFNNTISSERLEYRTFLWQRPAAYSGGTEARYLWNVMLYLTEGTARNINFGDSTLGYDVKVANSMLWQHYLNTPFVVFMLTIFNVFIYFSSFAHLLPFAASVGITFLLMQGINYGGAVFAASQSDGINAIGLTLKRILKLLPYFNSMFGNFADAFKQGKKQLFNFFKTLKNQNYQTDSVEGMISAYPKQVQFGTKVFLWMGASIALFGLLAGLSFLGLTSLFLGKFLISFFVITIFYFAAGVANMTGPNAYRAIVKDGTVKGDRVWSFFGRMFSSIITAPFITLAFVADFFKVMITGKSFMVDLTNKNIGNKGLLEKVYTWFEHGTEGNLRRTLSKQLNLETILKGLEQGDNASAELKEINKVITDAGYSIDNIKSRLYGKKGYLIRELERANISYRIVGEKVVAENGHFIFKIEENKLVISLADNSARVSELSELEGIVERITDAEKNEVWNVDDKGRDVFVRVEYDLSEYLGSSYDTKDDNINENSNKITKEKFAIKIYEKEKLNSNSKKSCVYKEIQILKKLKHKNIVKLIE